MKKYIGVLIVIFVFVRLCHGESIVCSIGDKFNKFQYIITGEVIGYEEHILENEENKQSASIQLKILKNYYTPESIEEVNIIIENSNLEYLEQVYPIGVVLSLIGYKSRLIGNKDKTYLGIGLCYPISVGSIEDRIEYDFEEERKKRSEVVKQMNLLDEENNQMTGNEQSAKRRVLIEELSSLRMNTYKSGIPEIFQCRLSLLEIMKARSKRKKYRLLKKLLWTEYIRKGDFIEAQDISEKMKIKLKLHWERLNKDWVLH